MKLALFLLSVLVKGEPFWILSVLVRGRNFNTRNVQIKVGRNSRQAKRRISRKGEKDTEEGGTKAEADTTRIRIAITTTTISGSLKSDREMARTARRKTVALQKGRKQGGPAVSAGKKNPSARKSKGFSKIRKT